MAIRRGNNSQGWFSCRRCPGGQEGWRMPPLPAIPRGPRLGPGPGPGPASGAGPGPGPAAFPCPVTAHEAGFWGPEEASCSWPYKTRSSVDLKYALQLIAFPVRALGMKAAGAAASAGSQARTGRAFGKGGKGKSPAAPATPAASSLPPPFPHTKYRTEYFTDMLKYVERLFSFLTEDTALRFGCVFQYLLN